LNIGGKGKFGHFSFNFVVGGLYVGNKGAICDVSLKDCVLSINVVKVWQGINRSLECPLSVFQLALHV
jgi:hypothetical protein